MTDPRDIQGSNAQVAEGGLNPAAAYAQPAGSTFLRMSAEAARKVEQQDKEAAGDPGTNLGRDRGAGR